MNYLGNVDYISLLKKYDEIDVKYRDSIDTFFEWQIVTSPQAN